MADNTTITTFQQLAGVLGGLPALGPLSEEALKKVIEDQGPDDATEALTSHLTSNSPLTRAVAEPVVADAISKGKKAAEGVPNEQKTATAAATTSNVLSTTLSGLAGADYALELSDPKMLSNNGRIGFAIALALISVIAALLLGQVPLHHNTQLTGDEAVSLGILASVAILAMIILVMGYKNVSVKGTRGAGARSSGSGSSSK